MKHKVETTHVNGEQFRTLESAAEVLDFIRIALDIPGSNVKVTFHDGSSYEVYERRVGLGD